MTIVTPSGLYVLVRPESVVGACDHCGEPRLSMSKSGRVGHHAVACPVDRVDMDRRVHRRWPPPRTATGISFRFAKSTAAITSPAFSGWTMTAGWRSIIVL